MYWTVQKQTKDYLPRAKRFLLLVMRRVWIWMRLLLQLLIHIRRNGLLYSWGQRTMDTYTHGL